MVNSLQAKRHKVPSDGNSFLKSKRDVFGETIIILIMINSLQDLHEVPEHLWSARKRHKVPSDSNFFPE